MKAWTDDMVSVFHRIGNRRANEYFEKTLDPSVYDRPAPDSDMLVNTYFDISSGFLFETFLEIYFHRVVLN